MPRPGQVHRDMVYASERNVDELEMLGRIQHRGIQRHVGEHDDIGIPAALGLDGRRCVLGICYERVAHLRKLLCVPFQYCVGYA